MSRIGPTIGAGCQHRLSKTAIWVAAARAIGAREPDVVVRNPDYLAEELLGDPAGLNLDHPVVTWLGKPYESAMLDTEVVVAVRAMIERTRFIDGMLVRAIANGVEQVLVLGAGLDSRAHRFKELLAHTRVFEVDRLATQEFKRQRIDAVLGVAPENLVYVPLSVKREGLATALAPHGYDTERKTLVIMEGVSMYLEEGALRAIFRFVAAHHHGSSVVFDMTTPAKVHELRNIDVWNAPDSIRPRVERLANMLKDEPWLFGIPLNGEREFLTGLGLHLGEILTIGGLESVKRYLIRADGTMVGADAFQRKSDPRRVPLEVALGQKAPGKPENVDNRSQESTARIAEAYVPYRAV